MIKAENLTKRFYDTVAVDHIHAEIHNGSVFGLIGTNGAGKSTFLRMAAGILKPDEGSVTVDDETVFENTKVKARCFYIPDEPYFLSNGTAEDMKVFYQGIYPKFDAARFDKLLKNFELESRRKGQTFSFAPTVMQRSSGMYADSVSAAVRNARPVTFLAQRQKIRSQYPLPTARTAG